MAAARLEVVWGEHPTLGRSRFSSMFMTICSFRIIIIIIITIMCITQGHTTANALKLVALDDRRTLPLSSPN